MPFCLPQNQAKPRLAVITFDKPLVLVRDLSPTVISVVEKLGRDCHDVRGTNVDGIEHVWFVVETIAYEGSGKGTT